jgi:hypothetical protein
VRKVGSTFERKCGRIGKLRSITFIVAPRA